MFCRKKWSFFCVAIDKTFQIYVPFEITIFLLNDLILSLVALRTKR